MESTINAYLPEFLQGYDPVLVFGVGFGLLLIIILIFVSILRALSRKKLRASSLSVQSFQIAPLGRDAFLKLYNPGNEVTLTAIQIIGRTDVKVKNEVAGHLLTNAGAYSILLEAAGNERLRKDFQVEFTFVDQHRQAFKQLFSLDPIKSIWIKRKRN